MDDERSLDGSPYEAGQHRRALRLRTQTTLARRLRVMTRLPDVARPGGLGRHQVV
ncbi:hypothetical protein [Streptomyces sp. NPDC050585]|uniref:hypothetical protein n=1 Tax=unclassified Streptomyces TaxID=2593676 RepID=UPI003792FB85